MLAQRHRGHAAVEHTSSCENSNLMSHLSGRTEQPSDMLFILVQRAKSLHLRFSLRPSMGQVGAISSVMEHARAHSCSLPVVVALLA